MTTETQTQTQTSEHDPEGQPAVSPKNLPDNSTATTTTTAAAVISTDDSKDVVKRIKDVDVAVPIVYGTIAFWLGRKATESQSHKWTVYVRSATNEDLTVVVKKVVFQLHPSFNNPIRVVESPPFELSECGWGEFEIAISLHFHADVCDKKLDLFHQLKLYPQEDAGPQSTKRPVVMESYDEVVFPDPTESFLSRVQNHPAVIMPRLPPGVELPPVDPSDDPIYRRGNNKDHHLCHWYTNFSEADELLKLAAARQQVQAHIVKLRRQMSMVEGSSLPPDPTSTF